MLLIIALVIASLFTYFLKDKLKQYPNIFYIGAAVVTIVIFSCARWQCRSLYGRILWAFLQRER